MLFHSASTGMVRYITTIRCHKFMLESCRVYLHWGRLPFIALRSNCPPLPSPWPTALTLRFCSAPRNADVIIMQLFVMKRVLLFSTFIKVRVVAIIIPYSVQWIESALDSIWVLSLQLHFVWAQLIFSWGVFLSGPSELHPRTVWSNHTG